MNKKVIKDNKEVFDHWLNGGSIQTIFLDDIEPSWKESPDSELIFIFGNIKNLNLRMVINDEYVEFRKALAEGKTVQYLVNRSANYEDIWDDTDIINEGIYRIKPDELKFKVGDWIRFSTTKQLLGKIVGFHADGTPYTLCGKDTITPNTLELELWTPKPNEWCVFWSTYMTEYLVSTFDCRRDCGAYITDYGHEFYNIAPLEFINTLKE